MKTLLKISVWTHLLALSCTHLEQATHMQHEEQEKFITVAPSPYNNLQETPSSFSQQMGNYMHSFKKLGLGILGFLGLGNLGANAAASSFIKVWDWNNAGNTYGYITEGNSIIQTRDGGFVTTGYTYSSGTGYDIILVKFTSSGALSWAKKFSGSYSDYGYSVVETSDGGFTITGRTYSSNSGYSDILLAKFTSSGTLS